MWEVGTTVDEVYFLFWLLIQTSRITFKKLFFKYTKPMWELCLKLFKEEPNDMQTYWTYFYCTNIYKTFKLDTYIEKQSS